MALEDQGWLIAEGALQRLSSQKHIEQIARKAQNSGVREHAVVLWTDDDVLADISSTDGNMWVSLTAAKCIAQIGALENGADLGSRLNYQLLARFRG